MSQSKSDQLYARMLGDILSLALAPDTPLRLPALSERYAIGLTPLRECLNRLSAEKYVVVAHNKGFRVAPLTLDDLLDLERSRNDIEGSLFAEAVGQGGDAWEVSVIGTFHHLEAAGSPSVLQDAKEVAVWTQRHAAFHAALISAASSAWMHRFQAQLSQQLSRYQLFIQTSLRDMAQTHPDKAKAAAAAFSAAMDLAPHRALFDAAMARDVAAAKDELATHARLSLQAFTDLMDLIPDETPLAATLRQSPQEVRP